MKVQSVSLSIIFTAAAAGVAVWLAVGHQAQLSLGEENKVLRQQLDPMAGLVAENDRLSNLVAQTTSSQSLHGDQ